MVKIHFTSAEALKSLDGRRRNVRTHVYRLLAERGPMHDAAILEAVRESRRVEESTARRRRDELCEAGCVAWTGLTEKTASGNASKVWAVVAAYRDPLPQTAPNPLAWPLPVDLKAAIAELNAWAKTAPGVQTPGVPNPRALRILMRDCRQRHAQGVLFDR